MGHYFGAALHLKFKKDIPDPVKNFLHIVFNENDFSSLISTEKMLVLVRPDAEYEIEYFNSLFYQDTAYIRGWDFRFFVFMESLDCYVVESRASIEWSNEEAIKDMLNAFLPFMEVSHGDILVRTCYEEGVEEEVFWYNEVTNSFVVEAGYRYEDECDDTHPSCQYDNLYDYCSVEETKQFQEKMKQDFLAHGYAAFGFLPPLNIDDLRQTRVRKLDPSVISDQ